MAGPFFNSGEIYVQARVARTLEKANYRVYLPQRDGFESSQLYAQYVAQGLTLEEAALMTRRTIFDVDVYRLYQSRVVVGTVAGIEADSGTVAELGMAFAMGKSNVLYTAEEKRTLTSVLILNPLLYGLTLLPVINSLKNVVASTRAATRIARPVPLSQLAPQLVAAILRGKKFVESQRIV